MAELQEVFPQCKSFVLGFIATVHERNSMTAIATNEILFPNICQRDVGQRVRNDYGDTSTPQELESFRKVRLRLI